MSSGFDDREKGFETKFAREQEFEFKIVARRNKLLGLWLADKFGLSGDEANAYASSVVEADFEEKGHEDVVRKVMEDISTRGLELSEHLVRAEMEKLLSTARSQLESDG